MNAKMLKTQNVDEGSIPDTSSCHSHRKDIVSECLIVNSEDDGIGAQGASTPTSIHQSCDSSLSSANDAHSSKSARCTSAPPHYTSFSHIDRSRALDDSPQQPNHDNINFKCQTRANCSHAAIVIPNVSISFVDLRKRLRSQSPPLDASSALVPPETHSLEHAGHYKLLSTIGSGSFSVVKLARGRHNSREVAIKILSRSNLQKHPKLHQLVQFEISIMKVTYTLSIFISSSLILRLVES